MRTMPQKRVGWFCLLVVALFFLGFSSFSYAQDYPQGVDTVGPSLFIAAANDPFAFWVPDPTPGEGQSQNVAQDDSAPTSVVAPSGTTDAPPDAATQPTVVSGPIVYGYINGVYIPPPYYYYSRSGYYYPYARNGYYHGYQQVYSTRSVVVPSSISQMQQQPAHH